MTYPRILTPLTLSFAVSAVASLACSAGDAPPTASRNGSTATGTTELAPGQAVGTVTGMQVIVNAETMEPILDEQGMMIAAPMPTATGSTATSTGTTGSTATSTGTTPGATMTNEMEITFEAAEETEVEACNELMVGFEKLEPTVLIVIDRSTSMRDFTTPDGTTLWEALRSALVAPGGVIETFQGDVDFGLMTFTAPMGQSTCFVGDGGSVEVAVDIPPAPAMYSTIAEQYNAAAAGLANDPNNKSETPTRAALSYAEQVLDASTATGRKYVLLVTDGQPDECNDGDPCTSQDSVLAQVQQMYAAGITTFVMTLDQANADLSAHVKDVADAGQGVDLGIVDTTNQTAGARTTCTHAATEATYQGAVSTVDLSYEASDQEAMAAQMASIIGGVRSCDFIMDNDIVAEKANLGRVALSTGGTVTEYTFEDANGWALVPPNVVQLQGAACSALQTAIDGDIQIEFPCEAYIR